MRGRAGSSKLRRASVVSSGGGVSNFVFDQRIMTNNVFAGVRSNY